MKSRSHQVTLAVIEGVIYLVDVGFGGNVTTCHIFLHASDTDSAAGPTRPLPLIPGHISACGSTQASHRLIVEPPTNPIIQPLWVLQYRISPSHDWKSLYGFTMTEFFPRDFEVMNLSTSASRLVFFTYTVVICKMIMDDAGEDIVGVVTLEGARLKRRIGGNTEELMTCKTEEERVGVLREYFGIVLSEKEQRGILRTVTALGPSEL